MDQKYVTNVIMSIRINVKNTKVKKKPQITKNSTIMIKIITTQKSLSDPITRAICQSMIPFMQLKNDSNLDDLKPNAYISFIILGAHYFLKLFKVGQLF